MPFKCPFCQRTFSRRSAYTFHTNKCILSAESSDEQVEDTSRSDEEGLEGYSGCENESTSENSKKVSFNCEEHEENINFEVCICIIYNHNI